MTQRQAADTGLLGAADPTPPEQQGPCPIYDLAGAKTDSGVGNVHISRIDGVAVIESSQLRNVRTPQGVGLGSTIQQVMDAYPGYTSFIVSTLEAPVPENQAAVYRFTFDKPDQLTHVSLSLKITECAAR